MKTNYIFEIVKEITAISLFSVSAIKIPQRWEFIYFPLSKPILSVTIKKGKELVGCTMGCKRKESVTIIKKENANIAKEDKLSAIES